MVIVTPVVDRPLLIFPHILFNILSMCPVWCILCNLGFCNFRNWTDDAAELFRAKDAAAKETASLIHSLGRIEGLQRGDGREGEEKLGKHF